MPDPLLGRAPPFDVAAGYHPFVDYRYVYAGRVRWLGAGGRSLSTNPHGGGRLEEGVDDPDAIRPGHWAVPHGIELRAQPAERSEPILTPSAPWEQSCGGGAVVRDGGLYRMWYHVNLPDARDPEAAAALPWPPDYRALVGYAESDDGFEWRKPTFGLYRWQDADTNIVFGRELTGPPGIHGEVMFVDPRAPAHQRYKSLYMGATTPEVVREWSRARPDQVDPWTAYRSNPSDPAAIFVATSYDGIEWVPHPDPVVITFSDTKNSVDWNPDREAYVWYTRGWSFDRRTIARAESSDFFNWPLPSPVVTAPPASGATTDLYTSGKVTYPGDPSTHLMFPTLYDRATDLTTIGVAASPDDMAWNWVPGNPVVEPGPEGSFDSASLFSSKGLVELPGDKIGIPFGGSSKPHKHPGPNAKTGTAWAMWPRGRIAGLEAAGDGEFHTPVLRLHGRRLQVNVKTASDGEVRVAALHAEQNPGRHLVGGQAQDGRGIDDARPISGDHLDAPVRWAGGNALDGPNFGPVVLQFRMRKATIFGFEVLD